MPRQRKELTPFPSSNSGERFQNVIKFDGLSIDCVNRECYEESCARVTTS